MNMAGHTTTSAHQRRRLPLVGVRVRSSVVIDQVAAPPSRQAPLPSAFTPLSMIGAFLQGRGSVQTARD